MAKKKKRFFDESLSMDSQDLEDVAYEIREELGLQRVEPLLDDLHVVEFLSMKYNKKFRKSLKGICDSKKEMKENFISTLSCTLDEVIPWTLSYGYRPPRKLKNGKIDNDNQKIREGIFSKFVNEDWSIDLVKYLTKNYKEKEFEDWMWIDCLPFLIKDIIRDLNRFNKEKEAKDPQAKENGELINTKPYYKLCETILKKKIKALEECGLSEDAAFDVACTFPSTSLLEFGRRPYSPSMQYFCGQLIFLLYDLAKRNEDVNFAKIIKALNLDEYDDILIRFIIREKRSKIKNFTAKQKALFNDITYWALDKMNTFPKEVIVDILKYYVKDRKRDESQGRDEPRRFYLSSVPQEEYKKIYKAVKALTKEDETTRKYL